MLGVIDVEREHAAIDARGRNVMYWPTLLRTRDRLVLRRPWRGSQRAFAQFMAKKLWEWKFNAKRGWWEAPLTDCSYQSAVAMCRIRIHRHKWRDTLNISDGVREWVAQEALDRAGN